MKSKDQQFHYVFALNIYENSLFFFFRLLFFEGTPFKSQLVAVLICYLYFIIYHREHNSLRYLFWSSLFRFALNFARNEACVVPKTSCSLRWCLRVFSTFKESCIIRFYLFLALFCFNYFIGNFLTTILKHVLEIQPDF